MTSRYFRDKMKWSVYRLDPSKPGTTPHARARAALIPMGYVHSVAKELALYAAEEAWPKVRERGFQFDIRKWETDRRPLGKSALEPLPRHQLLKYSRYADTWR